MTEGYLWIVFIVVFLALLFADLGLFNRGNHSVGMKKALKLVLFYICVALLFGLLIYMELGSDLAASYYAAYVIEMSMSTDNLFVFIVIFAAFLIPDDKQHRVLFWGILGAIFFRALFIFAGAELLSHFDFLMYVFGVILLYTAYKTAFSGDDDDKDTEDTFAFRLSKHIRATNDMSSGKFFTRENAKLVATPMFLCLVVIEVSDIMFAFDSVPAALSISTDVFVLYTANIFAVMGLRSLYFVIKNAIGSLAFLNYGLGIILAFIGIKMLLSAADILEIGVVPSLLVIVIVLGITILASLLYARRHTETE